jgi:hypothetical protein
MPCHRCGARQTDPVRGASPWRRGVRADEQVLVCPDCQRDRDWTSDLAHCAACGSAALVRRLGQTVCKDCGAEDRVIPESIPETGTSGQAPRDLPERPPARSLADDVAAALERQFGR